MWGKTTGYFREPSLFNLIPLSLFINKRCQNGTLQQTRISQAENSARQRQALSLLRLPKTISKKNESRAALLPPLREGSQFR